MAKRIVIEIDEDPALVKEEWTDFLDTLQFFISTYFDVHEITTKVENE